MIFAPYFVFLWMFIGCAVVMGNFNWLSQKVCGEIKDEKIELNRKSFGLNMAVNAVIWPIVLILRPNPEAEVSDNG